MLLRTNGRTLFSIRENGKTDFDHTHTLSQSRQKWMQELYIVLDVVLRYGSRQVVFISLHITVLQLNPFKLQALYYLASHLN